MMGEKGPGLHLDFSDELDFDEVSQVEERVSFSLACGQVLGSITSSRRSLAMHPLTRPWPGPSRLETEATY